MRLILASNSPRRKEILERYGYTFTVIKSDFGERASGGNPVSVAKNNAYGKATDVFSRLTDKENAVVLGADTIVVFGENIIGKPKDEEEAKKTLKRLSDNTHKVITGYALITKNKVIVGQAISRVTFNDLTSELIDRYVASGLPMDKAGSYGLQDGFDIVKKCYGEVNNVIGLPIKKIAPLLKKLGVESNL